MTHRKKDAPMLQPLDFAFARQQRLRGDGAEDTPPVAHRAAKGRPATLVAPVPPTGMRYAKPGERPPSKYAPGEDDGVIARYDAYAQAFWAGKVKRYGR